MTAHVQDIMNLLREIGRLLSRFLTFRIPTVTKSIQIFRFFNISFLKIALINGVAIAGGLLTALCHDVIIMNEEYGYLWMNEINNGLPMPTAGVALIK